MCTIVRLYFCPIIFFVFLQISCFQIFFCFTHRVHFFLHQPEQLLFLILLHREYLFIFYSNIAFLIFVYNCYFELCPIGRTYQQLLHMEHNPIVLHCHFPTSEQFSAPSCTSLINATLILVTICSSDAHWRWRRSYVIREGARQMEEANYWNWRLSQ